MHLKNRYVWLGIFLILLICISFLVCISNKKEKNNEQENETKIDISAFKIKDRVRLVKDNKIYIGENLKELENNFYDMKISTLNTGIELTLNKLWRYEVNNEYIEDEYLIEIVDKVVELLEIKNVKEDVSYELYKYIKQNFLKIKNNENVQGLELEEFKINSKTIEGECVIYIERK